MRYKGYLSFLAAILMLCGLLVGCTGFSGDMPEQAPQSDPDSHTRYQASFMGVFNTYVTVLGETKTEEEFSRYVEIIQNRMMELHQLYDIYNEYEGINNLYTINRNAGIMPVKVDKDIIDLLLLAKEGYRITDGATNVALGSVLRIWHEYRKFGQINPDLAEMPDMETLREALELTNIDDVVIDEENSTVFLLKEGMSLDVGAVAKAFAAERTAFEVRDMGFASFLLNAGGNITAVGKPANRARWGLGIQNPDESIGGAQSFIDTVYFKDRTVSISGGYQQYFIVDGKAYNHIIDPSTLMPANHYKQVAVIHDMSAMADMLSTALFILPLEEGMELLKRAGGEALWIDMENEWHATDGYIGISKVLGDYSGSDG